MDWQASTPSRGPSLYATLVLVMLMTTFITPIWLTRLEAHFTPDPTQKEGDNLARVMEA